MSLFSEASVLNPIEIIKACYGTLSSGETAELYTLTNNHLTIKITNFGGIITSINMPDASGKCADIVLGYDDVSDYENDPYYLGAVIGRYAGRIRNGKIHMNNVCYQLDLNANNSQLHGGKNGLHSQLWIAETSSSENNVSLILKHTSIDGSNGFPGNVEFCVKYTLNINNELSVEYFAKTDKTTIVNLTQHSYFNLAGHDQGSILDHQVRLNADTFLPMDKNAYPTGEIKSVVNTPYDFIALAPVINKINYEDEQINIGKGYDNYWLINPSNNNTLTSNNSAAEVFEPHSGRRLTLYTDQPSIIFYTGNYLNGSQKGKDHCFYQSQNGFCLEPQRAYDHSINKKNYVPFSTSTLEPNKPFYSKNVYVFDCVNK